jgi:site-specific DNA-methyltransferase (adenine-specific)
MIKLIRGDCMDVMKNYPDNYFDLAIVDPPYWIGEDGSKNVTRGKTVFGKAKAEAKNYKSFAGFDNEPPSIEYFKELFRVSKNQIIWGANHFMQNICLGSSCWVVWDKDNGLSDFADCELAYTSFKTAVRKFKFTWNGMLQGDMKNKELRIHPTQKPVKLYDWILENYSKPGQKILDTHLGSGSSAIAAHYFGCEFVGIELDDYYFKAASERFKNATAQVSLF